jgi:hypothetical protein
MLCEFGIDLLPNLCRSQSILPTPYLNLNEGVLATQPLISTKVPNWPKWREHRRRLLRLAAVLGQATIARRGYAVPETREVLSRSKMIIDDTPSFTSNLRSSMGYGPAITWEAK